MRYYVAFGPGTDEAPVVVDLVGEPDGGWSARVDERLVDLDVAPVGTKLLVRVDGRVVDLTTEGAPPEMSVTAGGHRLSVRIESERMRAAEHAKRKSLPGGETTI